MKKVKVGILATLVVGLSVVSIFKIFQKPTTNCMNEVSELTMASDIIGAILFASEENIQELTSVITPKTKVMTGFPYITIAVLANDGATVYVKVLLEDSATYTSAVETEVAQIKSSMHKDEMQCSMGRKKYDIYRAKTLIELKKISLPI